MSKKRLRTILILLYLLIVLVIPIFSGPDVGQDGSLSYSIPLELPAGTAGMGPGLSLEYNSNGGNGILGVGWDLGGIDVISLDSRYPMLINDGTNHYVSSYMYRGQRLIFGDDNYYHTEKESFLRIEGFDLYNDINSYWVVTDRNGVRRFYGQTDDSRIDAVSTNNHRAWALCKVIDVMGNYYTITYAQDKTNGDYYPERIVYTKNDANIYNKYRAVIFESELRGKNERSIGARPTRVEMDQRIRSIKIYIGTDSNGNNGILIRKYSMNYTLIEGRSFITGFDEWGNDEHTFLPSQTFTYTDRALNISKKNENFDIGSPAYGAIFKDVIKNIIADYNGDGRDDLIIRQRVNDSNEFLFNVCMGNIDGTFTTYPEQNFGVFKITDPAKDASYNYSNLFRAADVNGDGRMDILTIAQNGRDMNVCIWNNSTHVFDTTTITCEPWVGVGSLGENAEYSWRVADFNGDGRTDFMHYRSQTSWNIYFSKCNTESVEFETGSHGPIYGYTSIKNLHLGDFNGDGKMDYIAEKERTSNIYELYQATGNIKNAFRLIDDNISVNGPSTTDDIRLADFNGDGQTDIMVFSVNYTWNFYFSTGNGFKSRTYDFEHYQKGDDKLNIKLGDFNGDGMTDVMVYLGNHEWEVHFATCDIAHGPPFYTNNNHYPVGEYFSNKDDYFILNDYNGDGKTDFMAVRKNPIPEQEYIWKICISKGGGSFDQTEYDFIQYYVTPSIVDPNTGLSKATYPYFCMCFGDFNGDGKTDIIAQNKESARYWDTHMSGGKIPELLETANNGRGGIFMAEYTPAPQSSGAINSNGSDVGYPIAINTSPRALVTRGRTFDGFDQITYTEYEYASGRRYNGELPDRLNLNFAWIIQKSERGNFTATHYYQDPVRCGIASSSETRSFSALYSKNINTYVDVDSPTGGTAIRFVKKTDEWFYNFNGEHGNNPDNSSGISHHTKYSYDNYGNCNRIDNYGNSDNNNAITADDTYTTLDFTRGLNNLFKIYSRKTYACDKSGNMGIATESTTYFDNFTNPGDILKGLVTRTETKYDSSYSIVATFEFDNWGNVVRTKDGRANAGEYSEYTTTTTYDGDYHMMITRTSDAMGFATGYGYDKYLRPTTVTNSNGVVVSTTYYDVFNRPIKVVSYGDSESKPSIETIYNTNTKTPLMTITKVKEGEVSGSIRTNDTYTYTDSLNRVIQVKKEMTTYDGSENSDWSTVDFYYDDYGNQYKASMPYVTNTPDFTNRNPDVKFTITEYDDIGRAFKVRYPDNTVTQTIYSKLHSGVVDKNGHYTESGFDSVNSSSIGGAGRWEFAREYTGKFPNHTIYAETSTFTYRGGTEIKDAKGNKTTTEVDMLGRKTKITSPDMGTWAFTYDANGNKKTQTDAKGQEIKYTYDKLNRLITITYPDNKKTEFYYDGDDNRDGRIERTGMIGMATKVEYDPNNYIVNAYDKRGRLIIKTVTIDNISKREDFTYDSMNRVYTLTLPNPSSGGDREVLTYTYESSGGLNKINSNKVGDLIGDTVYNERGIVTNIWYRGERDETESQRIDFKYYDNDSATDPTSGLKYSYLLQSEGPPASGSWGGYKATYEYDKSGNIKKINGKDNSNYNESFVYDDLDRLTGASGYYGANKTYAYDTVGNITSKDGYNYSYILGTNRIESDGRRNFLYDANGNITNVWGRIKNSRTGKDTYKTLQDAYNEAQNNDTILASLGTFAGNIDSTVSPKNVHFTGGYDSNFTSMGSIQSLISGSIITNSSATLDFGNFIIGNGSGSGSGNSGLVYDYNNMMISSPGATYSYFGTSRVKKVENDVTTIYFFDNYEEEYTNAFVTNEIKYYGGFAVNSTKDGLLYLFRNHIGSVARINGPKVPGSYESTNNKVYEYDPFGLLVYEEGDPIDSKYKFSGKELDMSGFYYFGARYYDPVLGRFMSPDEYVPGGTPQCLNRYSYCGNNPVNSTDPSGNDHVGDFSFSDLGDALGEAFGEIKELVKKINIVASKPLNWLEIKNIGIGAFLGTGLELGLNTDTGDFKFGYGQGVLGYISVNHKYADIGGSCGFWETIGYNSAGDTLYVSNFYGMSISGVGTKISSEFGYSFQSGGFYANYSGTFGIFNGYVSMSSGTGPDIGGGVSLGFIRGNYSMRSGFSVGLSASDDNGNSYGINYNVTNGGWRGSVNLNICFVAGTKIKTEDGLKNIEDIKAGDRVLSMNEETGEFAYKEVVRTFTNTTENIVRVIIGDETIECTPEHPFWVVIDSVESGINSTDVEVKFVNYIENTPLEKNNKGLWISAKDLRRGMKLLGADGLKKDVTGVMYIKRNENTYNFEVADWHTYSVGKESVVVHNQCKTCKKETNKALARTIGGATVTTSVSIWAGTAINPLVGAGAGLYYSLLFIFWGQRENLLWYEFAWLSDKSKISKKAEVANNLTSWEADGTLRNICTREPLLKSPRPEAEEWQIIDIEKLGRKYNPNFYFYGDGGKTGLCPAPAPAGGVERPVGKPPR